MDLIKEYWFPVVLVLFIYLYSKSKKKKEEIKLEEEKIEKEKKNKIEKSKNDKRIEESFNILDEVQEQLDKLSSIEVIDVSDYKKIIIENEKLIIEKGGDNQLFVFLKIDTFLVNIKNLIEGDISEIIQSWSPESIKFNIIQEIKEYESKSDIEKLNYQWEEISSKIGNKANKNLFVRIGEMHNLGMNLNPTLEKQNKTLELYRNMAIAMILFYLNDKKIRYFEINNAFEKLGAFDSTFEKNVLKKLGSIENRLAQISNQLTDLNSNFEALINSNDAIIEELKQIDSSLQASNLIQSFTAYQTWRINNNTK